MKFAIAAIAAIFLSQAAQAETLSCASQDLTVSLGRNNTSCGGNNCNEFKKLTVTCKGKNPLILGVGHHRNTYKGWDPKPATSTDINNLAESFSDIAATMQQEESIKQYLAMLLTAKTANLSVTITYDPNSTLNYGEEQVILGVSF